MTRHANRPPGGGRWFRPPVILAALTASVALGACDYPTSLPIFESRWSVPAEETRFGVGELLPGDVTLDADSSAFVVDFDPVSFFESLGTLCPACAVANGLTVPKPPFTGTLSSSIDFPPEVSAVTVIDGKVVLVIQNSLNFDPLRPAAGVFGSMEVTLTDSFDGDTLGTLVLDGSTTSLAAGATRTDTLTLSAATLEGGIAAEAVVDSPLGDDVTIDSTLPISVTATPINVRVGAVTVDVAGRNVTLDPVEIDTDVPDELEDRIDSGAFVLDVTNPFAIGASFQLTIDGPTIAPINKSASIGPSGASTVTIAFTGAELRTFIGEPDVVLSGTAVIDPGASAISVNPGQELILSAQLDVTLLIGGDS